MMQKKPVNPEKASGSDQPPSLEFLPDSAKQVEDSINQIEYRNKLDKAFQAAIARVKKAS